MKIIFFLKIAGFHPNTLAKTVNILPLAQESSGFSTVGLSRLVWNVLRLNEIGEKLHFIVIHLTWKTRVHLSWSKVEDRLIHGIIYIRTKSHFSRKQNLEKIKLCQCKIKYAFYQIEKKAELEDCVASGLVDSLYSAWKSGNWNSY